MPESPVDFIVVILMTPINWLFIVILSLVHYWTLPIRKELTYL